jgi:ubiquinone/menaquinone biosynthesis C-methylase UbiE
MLKLQEKPATGLREDDSPSLRPMIWIYDRAMPGSFARQYYDNSGFFNFGYWLPQTNSQRAASEALVDRMVERMPNKTGLILDVACGLGASSERLARTFRPDTITGVNISESQVARARERCPASTFVVMDAAKLCFPDAHFDNVICVEAAFHFDTRDDFLREAFRVLKPGGSLVVSDILFKHYSNKLGNMAQVPRANHVLDIAEYRNRLAAAGFTNIEIEDETDVCLGQFCRNLARWPMTEYRAGRLGLTKTLGTSLVCRALAAYFSFTCKTYLLVSARKEP